VIVECYVCGAKSPDDTLPVGWEEWVKTPQKRMGFCPRHRRERSKAICNLAEMVKARTERTRSR
jgi:hypothetical protein